MQAGGSRHDWRLEAEPDSALQGKDRVVMLPSALDAALRLQFDRLVSSGPATGQPAGAASGCPMRWRARIRALDTAGQVLGVRRTHNVDDPRSGVICRHHLFEQRLQRELKRVVRLSGVGKR